MGRGNGALAGQLICTVPVTGNFELQRVIFLVLFCFLFSRF